MADEPAPPSVASHTSVLSNILSAIMHLIAVSPNAPSAASAAVSAAHREMATWNPPPEPPPAEEPAPDPAEPITEATGDGPPDDGDQPMDPHPPAG